MELFCPVCQTTNDGEASACRICGAPLEGFAVRPSPPPRPTAASPAWAESIRREIERWERDGLISVDLSRRLAEHYSWRQVVLGELARWQQEGIIPAEVARRLRAQYAPPLSQSSAPTAREGR